MILEEYRDLLQRAYDDAVHFTDDESVEASLGHLRFETENWKNVKSDYFKLHVFIRWLLERKKKFSEGKASVVKWLQNETTELKLQNRIKKEKKETK